MSYEIICSDSRKLLLESKTVDLVVTSPPYFEQKNYKDGGQTYAGQIGSIDHPGSQSEYLNGLWDVTRESMRVLKDTGSIWVNLGDKYVNKSLIGMPWRYAIGCIDFLGLTLRAEVIWEKSVSMPSPAKDRVRITHETWFHFVKREGARGGYYADLTDIREKPIGSTARAGESGEFQTAPERNDFDRKLLEVSPGGVTPHSVWVVPGNEGVRIPRAVQEKLGLPKHFAAFPQEWPRRIILGWSPPGGVVLDPFGGSGTTAGVAHVLGRHGINVDLSEDYCRLAEWRISESGHFNKSLLRTEKERLERLNW